MALGSSLAELASSLLVGQLNGPKGRLKPINKQHLDILLID